MKEKGEIFFKEENETQYSEDSKLHQSVSHSREIAACVETVGEHCKFVNGLSVGSKGKIASCSAW